MVSFLSDENLNYLQYQLRKIYTEDKWSQLQMSVRDMALNWFREHPQVEHIYYTQGLPALNDAFLDDMVRSQSYIDNYESNYPVELFNELADPNIEINQDMPKLVDWPKQLVDPNFDTGYQSVPTYRPGMQAPYGQSYVHPNIADPKPLYAGQIPGSQGRTKIHSLISSLRSSAFNSKRPTKQGFNGKRIVPGMSDYRQSSSRAFPTKQGFRPAKNLDDPQSGSRPTYAPTGKQPFRPARNLDDPHQAADYHVNMNFGGYPHPDDTNAYSLRSTPSRPDEQTPVMRMRDNQQSNYYHPGDSRAGIGPRPDNYFAPSYSDCGNINTRSRINYGLDRVQPRYDQDFVMGRINGDNLSAREYAYDRAQKYGWFTGGPLDAAIYNTPQSNSSHMTSNYMQGCSGGSCNSPQFDWRSESTGISGLGPMPAFASPINAGGDQGFNRSNPLGAQGMSGPRNDPNCAELGSCSTNVKNRLTQLNFGSVPVISTLDANELSMLGNRIFRMKDRPKVQKVLHQSEANEPIDDVTTIDARKKFQLDQIYNTPESRISTVLGPELGNTPLYASQKRTSLQTPCDGYNMDCLNRMSYPQPAGVLIPADRRPGATRQPYPAVDFVPTSYKVGSYVT